jgi:hypothetical protein
MPTADQIAAGLESAHGNVEQYTDGGDLSVEEFAGNWVQSVAKSGPRKGQTIWRHATTGRIWNGKGNPPADKPKVDDVHRDVMDVKSDITKATPEKIDELKAKIAKMSRADQDELKKRLGIKASGGTTAEHGAKIAGRALGNEDHTRKLIADARADSDANGADLSKVKALEDHLKTLPPETLTKLAGEVGVKGRAGKDLATKIAMKAVLSDEPFTGAAKTEPVHKVEPTAKVDPTAKPPKPSKPKPQTSEPKSTPQSDITKLPNAEFAQEVYDAVRELPKTKAGMHQAGNWFGDDRVMLDAIYDKLKEKNPGLTEEAFKQKLMDANDSLDLNLSRADLSHVMDKNQIKRSQIDHPLGATYHMLRLPDRGNPGTEYIPERQTAKKDESTPRWIGGKRVQS